MRAKRRAEIYAGKKVRRGEKEEMAVGRSAGRSANALRGGRNISPLTVVLVRQTGATNGRKNVICVGENAGVLLNGGGRKGEEASMGFL